MKNDLLTPSDVAVILSVDEGTVQTLAASGALRGTDIQGSLMFNERILSAWLESRPSVNNMADKKYLEKIRAQYLKKFPQAMEELQKFDAQFSFRRPKLFYLHKVPNKRNGFIWYARFVENGRQIPTRWCTHTSNREAAEQWAANNRELLLAEYHTKKKNSAEFFGVLEQYYAPCSEYLAIDENRGIILSEKTRSVYHSFVKKVLIKFFKEQEIKKFTEITPPVIASLQNHLLKKGNKALTINRYLGVLRTIINHLIMNGVITSNVFDNVVMLKERAADSNARGCYSVDRIKGVFNKRWKDKTSYILCLLIYSTGLRNSEIEKIKFGDIIKIEGCYFIDIAKSKTRNGIRVVPLHDFTYQKIVSHMKSAKKAVDDYLFSAAGGPNQSTLYLKAATDMADMLEADENERKDISFYSGRHFWKTLVNAHELGDVEEYFMGHKVSGDVSKRYNHLDKQGKKRIAEKAREVFEILDKRVFR
ncbi:MAG: tyrosine-type recombinase/integrase [Spirochaetaceae bacterium]|jgi:integrase|nr:tyrosine-type recombinase/integrase [Spirochaetaceae bacterium]